MNEKMHIVEDKADELKKVQSKKKLNFILNAQDQVKSTSLANVALILRLDPHLSGVFRWNVFTEAIDATKDVKIDLSKWNMPNINIKKGPINDRVIDDIALYCDIYPDYRVAFKSPLILQALGTVARDQAYNPITDYLKACYKKWDKKARITDFLPDYLGADRSDANELIIKLVLMGVVAKAANPDTKFDWVLDLVGGQGVGKTTLLMKLAPPGTYTDQFLSFTDKDDFASMRNALIVNDDEMTVSNRTSFEEIKKFITMREFTYRPPYARSNETFKKKFILFRTTNEVRHLKDKSGDRRFLSIMCHREQQKLHPVTDLGQDYIDQIWGEAVHLYKTTTEPFKLNPEQNELLDESRQQFMYTSALEDNLRDALSNDFADKTFISNSELWTDLQVIGGGTKQKTGYNPSKDSKGKTSTYTVMNYGTDAQEAKGTTGTAWYGPIMITKGFDGGALDDFKVIFRLKHKKYTGPHNGRAMGDVEVLFLDPTGNAFFRAGIKDQDSGAVPVIYTQIGKPGTDWLTQDFTDIYGPEKSFNIKNKPNQKVPVYNGSKKVKKSVTVVKKVRGKKKNTTTQKEVTTYLYKSEMNDNNSSELSNAWVEWEVHKVGNTWSFWIYQLDAGGNRVSDSAKGKVHFKNTKLVDSSGNYSAALGSIAVGMFKHSITEDTTNPPNIYRNVDPSLTMLKAWRRNPNYDLANKPIPVAVPSGSVLEFDGENMKTTVNGTVVEEAWATNYPKLRPGKNKLVFVSDADLSTSKVVISYNPRLK